MSLHPSCHKRHCIKNRRTYCFWWHLELRGLHALMSYHQLSTRVLNFGNCEHSLEWYLLLHMNLNNIFFVFQVLSSEFFRSGNKQYLTKSSPKFSLDLENCRRDRNRGTSRYSYRFCTFYSDGVHPIQTMARLWLLRNSRTVVNACQ